MFSQPMSWLEPREDDPNPLAHPDLVLVLQQQIASGFPSGLALDLVLNELVVRAAAATRASGGALALMRGEEMVCRAATGDCAPDLGVALNIREGVSGACFRMRQAQLCRDTESDSRVIAEASRQMGIRSMLVVPVLEGDDLAGVLEVFASEPNAFVESDIALLAAFASECARIRRAAEELEQKPVVSVQTESRKSSAGAELLPIAGGREFHATRASERHVLASPDSQQEPPPHPYDSWTVVLGTMVVLSVLGLGFMISSRLGWLGTSPAASNPTSSIQADSRSETPQVAHARPQTAPAQGSSARAPDADALVVYEQGREVFRMKPARPRSGAKGEGSNAGTSVPAEPARVWLAPTVAERRLQNRVEPQYPAAAIAAHRAGDVTLEVLVGADGRVISVRTLSGDPILAEAAMAAVRSWHYQPYRLQKRPAEFQTEVTLKFSLPDS